MAESLHTDVKQDDDNGSEKADRFDQKVKTRIRTESFRYDSCEQYHMVFLSQHDDNPIKVSVWPVFFAFGLLYSRFSGNTTQRRPTPHVRRLNRAEEFALSQLAAATNDFSLQNKIGVGRSYVVYRGKLPDGREVAVKRGDIGHQRKKFQEEDSFFETELTFLSRLHHKHLTRLVGYCEEENERILFCKRPIFNNEDNGGAITSIVDFAVPKILANELVKVLDSRIGPPELDKEAEPVELVAYTALHCVNLQGNNRPSMTSIVANLEQAFSVCDIGVVDYRRREGAEESHCKSDAMEPNSNRTEKHYSEISERQQ
ncbi:hypothetical protein GH714_013481 [Hevea brasiliensis]|uniref:Serine-threonine/tyrosine-protein kinase catalytic domain-containing protein n=1 Tax=Hevea brasiliensis TaxID=3981 RepID=A0A6A6N149_HEVBR|nr:hypothetical protein GH714_013481 [Hevea brasiliensis]